MAAYNCIVDGTIINREITASTVKFLSDLGISIADLAGTAIALILNTNGQLTPATIHLHVDRSNFVYQWKHSNPTPDTFNFESSLAVYIRVVETFYVGLARAIMYHCTEDVNRQSGLDVWVTMSGFDIIDDGPSLHLVFNTDYLPF